jgi:PqqD family protein of HPr-rel-A system
MRAISLPFDFEQRSWWRRAQAPVWETLPGASAVFDPDSGETHFLAQLPALLLPLVSDRPATAAELVSRLAGPVELDASADAQIVAALSYLEDAELVESGAPQPD